MAYPSPTGLPPCESSEDICTPCNSNPDFDMSNSVNNRPSCCSVCTGDVTCNMFFQARAAGFHGRCILDEMTYEQVWFILTRNPNAKRDLMRITTDPILLSLARESGLVETDQQADEQAAKRLNANSLVFYTHMRGNPFGDII